MKKIILLIGILLICNCSYAATITITIPDNKVQAFKDAFLRKYPVPDDNLDGQPDYTELLWFKQWIKRKLIQAVQLGNTLLYQDGYVETLTIEDLQ